MKPDTYKLMERCIDDGVAYGLRRAYKHTDDPTAQQVHEAILLAVMNEICQWFKFEPRED